MSYAPELNTKRELWLPAVTFAAGDTRTLQIDEVPAASVQITIPAGTYYGHKDASFPVAYPSFYQELEDQLNASVGLSGTYTVSAATPTSSSQWTNLGLQITVTGITSFSVTGVNDEVALPAVENMLGMQQDTTVASVGTTWTSPFTRGGKWVANLERTDALAPKQALIAYSTEYTERADAYAVDYGARSVRGFLYELTPAASVYEERATRARYAAAGALAQNDVNNAFETTWRLMRGLDDAIIVYYEEADPFDLEVDSRGYEIVRMNDPGQAGDFAAVIGAPRLRGPETYDVAPIVSVVTSQYDF